MADSAARARHRGPDLAALAAITDAVEAGAGLPEILRAAARALDASLILIDRSAAVLAVAARSPADERSLMRDADDVTTIELKVAEAPVGQLRMRSRDQPPDGSLLRLVTTLIASEVERVRAPERASEEAATSFQRAVLRPADRRPRRPDRARQGARHRPLARRQRGRRPRPPAQPRPRTTGAGGCSPSPAAARARSRPARSPRRPRTTPARSIVLVPDRDGETGRRVVGRDPARARVGPAGFAFAIGRSRRAEDPLDLHRAGNEALLAANVVEGDAERLRARATRRPAPTSCCCRT